MLLSLALLLGLARGAEDPVPPEARAAWDAMVAVPTLEARFTQTRVSTLLQVPLVATGSLRFARPDKLAWRVAKPGRAIRVMEGANVGMSWPDLGVREEIDLSGNPEIAGVVRGMMTWLSGDLASVQADYELQWEPGPPAIAHLKPRAAGLAAILTSLDLELGGTPTQVQAVTLHEPGGDRVEIRLSEVHPGASLPPDAFTLPPAQ